MSEAQAIASQNTTFWWHPESQCIFPVVGEVSESTALECVELSPEEYLAKLREIGL